MINKLSKEKYFKYDSKELLGVMRFDFYDGRLYKNYTKYYVHFSTYNIKPF